MAPVDIMWPYFSVYSVLFNKLLNDILKRQIIIPCDGQWNVYNTYE